MLSEPRSQIYMKSRQNPSDLPAIRISTLDPNLSDCNAEHVEVEPDCFLWFIARIFCC